jgi:CheY-like chemotaxis protein
MARILLVSGTANQQRTITTLLAEDGHQIECASDVSAAWEQLHTSPPDLLMADLAPPELPGLTLVRKLRAEGWPMPVVVITENGSEQLAAEALAAGASSYVAASRLDSDLREVVDELAHYLVGESNYERLMGCARKAEFAFELDNDPALIPPLADLIQQMIAGICSLAPSQRLQLGVAFEQAMHNALFRGNLEIPGPGPMPMVQPGRTREAGPETLAQRGQSPPYAARRVRVLATIEPHEIRLRVGDDGPGFDFQRLVSQQRHPGPQGLASSEVGRGLVLMQLFTDELCFAGRGNEVTLIKRSMTAPPVPSRETPETGSPRTLEPQSGTPASRQPPRILATMRSLETQESWELTSPHITIGRDEKLRHRRAAYGRLGTSLPACSSTKDGGSSTDLRTKNGIRVNGLRVAKRPAGAPGHPFRGPS